ncbi:MAG TPA: hypothetical protein PKM88_11635 [bacterium]|nr:hypothetical protein [bacterium]
MFSKLRTRQYAILFAAVATSAAVWYIVFRPPAPVLQPEERTAYIEQLETIRGSVREQMLREAGQQAPGLSEQEQLRTRTRALMEQRLTEAGVPDQLHNPLQDAVERDVMNQLADSAAVATSAPADTELNLYRHRERGPGPVVYY